MSFRVPGFGFRVSGGNVQGREPSPVPHSLSPVPCLQWMLTVACVLVLAIVLPACGKKTPVRPPAFVLPEPTGDLTLDIAKGSVVLRWGRPQEYVDGSEMEDLSGFVVLRATQDAQGQTSPFAKVATIPVEDRDRFRKAKRFTYTDTQLTAGTLYRYRIQSFTADGYASDLSNTVELVWKGEGGVKSGELKVESEK